MATRFDLEIDQGSEFHLIVGIASDWLPSSLSGWNGRGQIRPLRGSAEVLATLDAYLTVDVPNRQLDILIPAADSAAWTWRNGVYDIEIYSGATVGRLLQGSVVVDQEVTRG